MAAVIGSAGLFGGYKQSISTRSRFPL